jgi:hypothetical protein
LRPYNVVECLTNDGYFSVDVHLPDANVAVEIDGRAVQVDGINSAYGFSA